MALLAGPNRLLSEYCRACETSDWHYTGSKYLKLDAGQVILAAPPEKQVVIALQLSREVRKHWRELKGGPRFIQLGCIELLKELLRRERLPYTGTDIGAILKEMPHPRAMELYDCGHFRQLVQLIGKRYGPGEVSADLVKGLRRFADALTIMSKPEQRLMTEISALLRDDPIIPIQAGESWADQALADLGSLSAEDRTKWAALVMHCLSANAAKPSAKWLKTADELIAPLGATSVSERVSSWLPLLDQPRRAMPEELLDSRARSSDLLIIDPHVDILKGLVWCLAEHADAATIRAIGSLVISALRKVPGVGPRCVKLANAGIYALGRIPGPDALARLAALKVKVKFGIAQKQIDKALDAAAEREGIPREEIEEIAAPGFGMVQVGMRRESLGDYTAELIVTGTSTTELRWIKPDGKAQKSVPKAVKDGFPDDLNEFKAAAKDIQKMLPAQRDRIDQLFLQQKTWPFATWAERYLNHPLVGTIARRLIWEFEQDNEKIAASWLDGRLVDAKGDAATIDEQTAVMSLWHPIDHAEDEILAWRQFFEQHEIRQPFKQAHREVYLLTDAERNTRIYSNRFGAHVIRQHQFKALADQRGWKYALQGAFDSPDEVASKHLPPYRLKAEFWVDRSYRDDEEEYNDSGIYWRVVTDQVRFYPIDSRGKQTWHGTGEVADDAVPLDDIPPLVFSEIMRDVDLFIGVASVGNDPQWQDGGPEGRYRDYWQDYSFGDLSATAKTRRVVLEQLVPRLKIADRCTIDAKFFVVRGNLRTYKIHLGSGNILMSPNDQYLCIVADRATVGGAAGQLFLPFEGDRTLSIILSKAFMLAEDTKIKDRTIISQIKR